MMPVIMDLVDRPWIVCSDRAMKSLHLTDKKINV